MSGSIIIFALFLCRGIRDSIRLTLIHENHRLRLVEVGHTLDTICNFRLILLLGEL
jgi:hypothetical protein